MLKLGQILTISLALLGNGLPQTSVTSQGELAPYVLSVPVDEVSLVFHASDFQGRSLNDLTVADLRLSDNGKPQKQILSFQFYPSLPIRAGILFDTSRSMLPDLKRNQTVAELYATRLLRKGSDRAFVMRFDSDAKVTQSWTDDSSALTESLHSIAADHASRLGGTELFDSIYKACRDQWTSSRNEATGNFILLFTDGIDNASHTRIEDVIEECQGARAAIYVFLNEPKSMFSEGQKTLKDLVNKSGGRIFFAPKADEILEDLYIMEGDQRSQYRLVYRPLGFHHDGSFHRIRLDSPTKGGMITTRSGYYAMR